MEKAKITYSAKIHDFKNYDEDISELFGGTYTVNEPLVIDVRIWNNRYGTSAVEDLKNFALNIFFEHFEDASLVKYITVTYKDTEELTTYISDGVLTAAFISDDIVISGSPNNGLASDTENYIDIVIKLDTSGENLILKNRDMKSMFLEIIEL